MFDLDNHGCIIGRHGVQGMWFYKYISLAAARTDRGSFPAIGLSCPLSMPRLRIALHCFCPESYLVQAEQNAKLCGVYRVEGTRSQSASMDYSHRDGAVIDGHGDGVSVPHDRAVS